MRISVKILVALSILLLFTKPSTAQTDVVIAVDLSKTMERNDPNKYRFEGADMALTMFAFYARNNRGGVVSFGDDTAEVFKLEYLAADQFAKYKPVLNELGSEEWTELGKGLERSRKMLGTAERRPSIILISDGIVEGNPDARGLSKEQAKDQAVRELWTTIIPSLKAARIRVYTIGLFRPGEGDEKTLKEIAEQTGGFYTYVQNPEQFPQIYKRMLDDIDQPSGVTELTNGSSIVLTPVDQGLIVLAPKGFELRGPKNLSYSTDRQTVDTPVRQKFFEYKNNTAILLLGRPDNLEVNGQFWNGRWVVEGLNGKGEATFISKVRLDREGPKRRAYFLNEFYQFQYRFVIEPESEAELILSKCRTEYVLVPQGHSSGKPELKTIVRQGNVFSDEVFLGKEGEYLFEIKIRYDEVSVDRWTQHDRFHVSKIPLLSILDFKEPSSVGSKFRIEVQQSGIGTAGLTEARGIVDSSMGLFLRYGSGEPISVPVKTEAGVFRSEELEFAQAGDLNIDAELTGKLLMQLPGPNGEDILTPHKVKTRVSKKLNVENTFLATMWTLGGYGVVATGLISSLITILGLVFRRPRFNDLDQASLAGQPGTRTITLEPQNLSRVGRILRWFMVIKPSATSIGGSESGADVTDATLDKGGAEPIVKIGVNRHREYNITRTGTLRVWVNSSELELNQPQPLSHKAIVHIKDVGTFKFID